MTNTKQKVLPTDPHYQTKRQYQYKEGRMFIYVTKAVKSRLKAYADSDPRFKSWSKCAVYLINLGLKHDKKDRAKSLRSVEK